MTGRRVAVALAVLAGVLWAGASVAPAAGRHPVVVGKGKDGHAPAAPDPHARGAGRRRATAGRRRGAGAGHRSRARAKPRDRRGRTLPASHPVTVVTSTTTATTSDPSAGGGPDPAAGATTVVTSTTSASTSTATETATSTSTPAPARLQVVAQEYSFVLSRTSVPAGPVIIEYDNRGQDPHNLNYTPAGSGGAATAAFGSTLPGAHPDVEFTFAAGTYTLFCSLPGHAAMGMMATLTVF